MRSATLSVLLLSALGAVVAGAADLLSAFRLADTIVSGERRIAIVETSHGEQRFVTEGERLAGCLVKHIRVDGMDLDCRGRSRSLAFSGRARSAALAPADGQARLSSS